MKILVLGISGMLGSTAFRLLHSEHGHEVHGTARTDGVRRHFAAAITADRHDRQPLAGGTIARRIDVGDDVVVDDP